MNDKDLLFRIIKIEKTILNLYCILYDLEINNKNDDLEYKRQINNLKISIEIEEELISKISLEKTKEFIKYLNDNNHLNTLSDFDFILNKYEHLYILKRLYERLHNKIDKDLLISLINEDTITYFLSELDLLSFKYEKSYKDIFIKSKYVLSFINRNIEIELLNNNFKVNKYLISKSYAILNNIDDYDLIFCDYLSDNLYKYMMYFLKFKKFKDLDIFETIKIIYYQILIKSISIFASKGLLNSLLFDIYDILDEECVNIACLNRIKHILKNKNKVEENAKILIIERINNESSK